MNKKKYEVTEEGERGPEQFIRYRIPQTHCECQKIIIIITAYLLHGAESFLRS